MKHPALPGLCGHLEALAEAPGGLLPSDEPHVEAGVRETAAQRHTEAGFLIEAARVAIPRRTANHQLFELIAWRRAERALARPGQLEPALESCD